MRTYEKCPNQTFFFNLRTNNRKRVPNYFKGYQKITSGMFLVKNICLIASDPSKKIVNWTMMGLLPFSQVFQIHLVHACILPRYVSPVIIIICSKYFSCLQHTCITQEIKWVILKMQNIGIWLCWIFDMENDSVPLPPRFLGETH